MKNYLFFLFLLVYYFGWGQTTITINLTSAGGSVNLGTTNYGGGIERAWSQNGVDFGGKQITSNGSNIQVAANNGVFYNRTALPGRILNVVINYSGTARTYNFYGGNSTRLINDITGDYNVNGGTQVGGSSSVGWDASNFNSTNYRFFAIKRASSNASQIVSLVITYEDVPTCTTPTTQATNFTSSSITQTSATIGWARGNGNNVLVVARAGGAVNADPISGTTYSANAAFGSGQQIGTGNYVVYNGTGTSVNLTNLTAGTTYHFAVYEYNDLDVCYNTTELTGDLTTLQNPSISISPTTTLNLGTNICAGSYRTGTYTVSGSNLTDNIELTPSSNLEISLDGTTWFGSTSNPKLTLVHSGGTVSNSTIQVRSLNSLPVGTFSGSITHTSTGATTVTKSVSGTIVAPQTPTITIARSSGATIPMCGSQTITFTATTTNLGGGTASLQWKRNGINVGTNSNTYTLATPTNNDIITCEITNITNGCVTATTAISNEITMVVYEVPSTPVEPTITFVCNETTASAVTSSQGTVYWQTTATGTTETNPANTSRIFTTNGTHYLRTKSVEGCWSAARTVNITVQTAPSITTQPVSISVYEPNSAVFSIVANNHNGIQWQKYNETTSAWENITGATGATYTITPTDITMDGDQFRAIVSSTNVNCPELISDIATLTISPPPTPKRYTLVTSVSDLEVGKKYLIVNSSTVGTGQALGLQNSNNRAQSSVTIVSGTPNYIITTPASSEDGTEPFELTLGGTTGAWTLYDAVNGGFLHPTSGSNNLQYNNVGSYNYDWNISIASPGSSATIRTSTNNRAIRYNSSASVFSAYQDTSNQKSVYLFKEGESIPFHTYFRSKTNGEWTSSTTWESSEDGIIWGDALSTPNDTSESVVIQEGHTVDLNSPSVTITNTQVFGTIEVTTSEAYSIVGDDEIELTIEDGGVFLVSSPGSFEIPNFESFGLVKTGGKLIAGPLMGISSGTAFVNAYIGYNYGLFYFGDQAICEWANPSTSLGSSSPDDQNFFFPYEDGDMPIFRIIVTPAHSFGNNLLNNIFYSKLEIVSPASFSTRLNGNKTFVGRMSGDGVFIQEDGGNIILGDSETVPVLEDSITLNVLDQGLRIVNGLDVPENSNVTIQSTAQNNRIIRENGSIEIDGQLNITNMRIVNSSTGGISVNNGGNLNTTHTEGIYGTNAAIENGTLTLNSGSTIEYSALGNQVITTQLYGTSPNEYNYQNLLISGSGEKSPNDSHLIVNNITTVESGNLVIQETADEVMPNLFTSKKGVQVAETGNLILENNANLFQDEDAVNIGKIEAQREATLTFISVAERADYNYWSSPVADQKLLFNAATPGVSFSPGTPNNRIFQYKESNDMFVGTPDANFVKGKGYAIRAENAANGTSYIADGNPKTFKFIGTPNNGTFETDFDLPVTHQGYNIVGNPYPSNIDLDLFWDVNENVLNSAAYFWTNNNYEAIQQGSEYSGNNYASISRAGGVHATFSALGEGITYTPTTSIKPGQGFLVQAKDDDDYGKVIFNNDMRMPALGHFFNNKNEDIAKNRFWIQLISPNNLVNTLLLGYLEGATNEFDANYDIKSPMNSDALYTLSGEDKLLIQAKDSQFELSDVVPLGANFFQNGEYRISLSQFEGIFAENVHVLIKDNQKGRIHNLTLDGDYIFETEEGEIKNRFEIVYEEETILGNEEFTNNNELLIVKKGDVIWIKSDKENLQSVQVYDLSGKLIYHKNELKSKEITIPTYYLINQNIIVNVVKENGETKSKKLNTK